jgi:N-acetylglucosaminyldiphosphoundecaprenol N-acetyl-beta-D-mannosaminyltransferase
MARFEFFNCPLDAMTMEQTVALIKRRILLREFTQHVVVNVAKLVNMQRDPALTESVKSCDIVNIDGMGVVWGARILGHRVPERVAGIDLFDRLLCMAAENNLPVYLLGATEEVVKRTVAVVRDRYPSLSIAGYHNGYFWEDERAVVDDIRDSKARLLFVAITSPKKERFVNQWRQDLGVDFAMGVGGTFDVVAGKVRRAPGWMQRCGLEWAFRVLQEPTRMWKRYSVTNARFAMMLLVKRLQTNRK